MINALEVICKIPLDETSKILASLPDRYGGVSIRKICSLAIPAYMSSVNATKILATQIYDGFELGESHNLALSLWTDLDHNLPSNPCIQSEWDNIQCLSIYNALLSSLDNSYSQAHLQSHSLKNASAWLNAVPSEKVGCQLTNEEVRISISRRLSLPLYQEHLCKCGAVCDTFGKHAFSCKLNNGRFLRHNGVNTILHKALSAAGLPNRTEPSYLSSSNNLRPDGITLLPFHRGKSLVWDVTCPHPLITSNLVNFQSGKAAKDAEIKKTRKYQSLSEDFYFVPCAIETTGGYGPKAESLINKVASLLKEKTGDIRAGDFLKQRLSIAIQRGNSKTCLFSLV